MDPNATATEILSQVHEVLHGDKADPEALASAVADLFQWLASGGFPPDWQRVWQLGGLAACGEDF